MSSPDTAMAAVAPMLVNSSPHHHGNQEAFSHHHHRGNFGRRGSSDLNFPHSSSHSSVMSRESKERQLTSLEDLAAKIEEQTLREDRDSAAFSYLGNKLKEGINNDSGSYFPKKTRSLPSSYYRTSDKSSDTTKAPLRKVKSVRFADTFGLPLVKTVLQLTNDDSSYTANKIVPYAEEDLLCKSPLIIGSQRPKNSPSSSSDDLNSDEASPPSKYVLHQGPTSPTYSTHKHTFSFTLPSLEPDFMRRVERESVVLESAREEPRTLHGIIRVSNLSYTKEVVVRWTHDNWRTSHDTVSVFCSNDGSTDRFAFELPINGDDVSFAIRYRVSDKDYWDNNHGANYTVFSRPL